MLPAVLKTPRLHHSFLTVPLPLLHSRFCHHCARRRSCTHLNGSNLKDSFLNEPFDPFRWVLHASGWGDTTLPMATNL